VFSDASNELAYTVQIDIISGPFAFRLVMQWRVKTYTSRSRSGFQERLDYTAWRATVEMVA
jgi:hypothetical protein